MAPTDTTKCKCWKRPFEPPHGCYEYCTGRILRFASTDDLQNYLKIEEDLAEKIFETTANEKLITLSDFHPYFTAEEFDTIKIKMNNMDHKAENWLKEVFKAEMEAELSVYA